MTARRLVGRLLTGALAALAAGPGAAAASPGCPAGATCLVEASPVPGTADLTSVALQAAPDGRLVLGGRAAAGATAPVLLREPGTSWRALASPVPHAATAPAATTGAVWALTTTGPVPGLRRWPDDPTLVTDAAPIATAACGGAGATAAHLAAAADTLVAAVLSPQLTGDPTQTGAVALGVREPGAAGTTWACSFEPVVAMGRPALEPDAGRAAVPVVRLVGPAVELQALEGRAGATPTLVGGARIAGTQLACGSVDANSGAAAFDAAGRRVLAGAAPDGRSVRLIAQDGTVRDLPAGGDLTGYALVAGSDGVLVVAVTADPTCTTRDVAVLRPDGSSTPLARGLPAGCSTPEAALAAGRLAVAVPTQVDGACAVLLLETATRAPAWRTPGASASAARRSPGAGRSRPAR